MFDEIELMKEEWVDEIVRLRELDRPLILFGAGCTSQFIVEQLESYGVFPTAFCDNNADKIGTIVAGLQVISIGQLLNEYQAAYIYITTQLFYTEIKRQLISLGISCESISDYDIIFQMEWERNYWEYCKSKKVELEQLYHKLGDDKSRKVLFNRLAFFRTRNRKYMSEIRDKDQYFDSGLIDFRKINTFVDCGMYIGDTIIQFLKVKNDKCEIWGFEPDSEISDIAKCKLAHLKESKIHIIEKATSDECGTIKVRESLGVMQTIENSVWGDVGESEKAFEVCTLDDIFEDVDTAIDFIKMDIEGAELASLRGGAKLIKKNCPILAVCVYHKKEDLFTIPQLILSMNEKYKLYLRHYSDNQTETVLYALSVC